MLSNEDPTRHSITCPVERALSCSPYASPDPFQRTPVDEYMHSPFSRLGAPFVPSMRGIFVLSIVPARGPSSGARQPPGAAHLGHARLSLWISRSGPSVPGLHFLVSCPALFRLVLFSTAAGVSASVPASTAPVLSLFFSSSSPSLSVSPPPSKPAAS